MAYVFPSEEWVAAYWEAINASDYTETGKTWNKGPVSLVCKAEPSVGLDDDVGIWLDLHEGQCREAKIVAADEAREAPYVITGKYARWKQVIQGKLDPVKGMMQGKLRLKGDLPTIVRYVKASKTLVASATQVDTEFLDD